MKKHTRKLAKKSHSAPRRRQPKSKVIDKPAFARTGYSFEP